MNSKILAIFIAIPVLFSALTGCGSKEVIKEANKNVKVTPIEKSALVLESEFAGEIKPVEEAGVISKMPGKVKEILVNVGKYVKAGDVLFTLDSEDIKAQFAQAEAGVAQAQASLNKTKNTDLPQLLQQVRVEYDQARLNYDTAKIDYSRAQTLYESASISKSQMDAYTNNQEFARQRYEFAKNNLERLEKSGRNDTTKMAESQYNQALSSLDILKTQLDSTIVRAPISGFITAKNINIGEGVSSAAFAMVVADTSQLTAEINIPEKLINKFKIGQKLSVNIQSLGSKSYEGEVVLINPAADSATRNYKVKVKLLDNSNEIKPGMFAKIKVAIESKNDIISVPNQAILTENGVNYIYIVKDSKVAKVPVKTGISNESNTEITEGLNLGDSFITSGQSFLSDGEKVNVLK